MPASLGWGRVAGDCGELAQAFRVFHSRRRQHDRDEVTRFVVSQLNRCHLPVEPHHELTVLARPRQAGGAVGFAVHGPPLRGSNQSLHEEASGRLFACYLHAALMPASPLENRGQCAVDAGVRHWLSRIVYDSNDHRVSAKPPGVRAQSNGREHNESGSEPSRGEQEAVKQWTAIPFHGADSVQEIERRTLAAFLSPCHLYSFHRALPLGGDRMLMDG